MHLLIRVHTSLITREFCLAVPETTPRKRIVLEGRTALAPAIGIVVTDAESETSMMTAVGAGIDVTAHEKGPTETESMTGIVKEIVTVEKDTGVIEMAIASETEIEMRETTGIADASVVKTVMILWRVVMVTIE